MTQNLSTGVKGITLYTGTNLPKHGKTVTPIEELKTADWYNDIKDSVNIKWYDTKEELFCAKRILNTKIPYPKDNILIINSNFAHRF